MISIKQETYENPLFGGGLSNYMLYLYTEMSQKPFPNKIDIPNDQWIPFLHDLYYLNGLEDPEFIIKPELIPPMEYDSIDPNKAICALSGGKDSVSVMLRLIDEGKDVTAYFMQSANASYLLEEGKADRIAEKAGILMVKDKLHRSGKTDYFENQLKNQLMLARMLEYGLRHNCATLYLGEYWDSIGDENALPEYNMTDNTDLTNLMEKAYQSHVPEFKFDYFYENEAYGMSYIITKHPDYIPLIQSCIMPTRYMKQQLKFSEKYHLHADVEHPDEEGVMEGRCMNCYKCAIEWVYLVMWGKLPMDKKFYEEKVIPLLYKKRDQADSKMADVPESELSVSDILNLWVYLNKGLRDCIKDPANIEKGIRHKYPELS